MNFKIVEWNDKNQSLVLIDQRQLPAHETYLECKTYKEVCDAICNMTVRGAPAIGVTAAFGYALGALQINAENFDVFYSQMQTIYSDLYKTRPTAVNLEWALKRMNALTLKLQNQPLDNIKKELVAEACAIQKEDIAINKSMGQIGQVKISDGDTILTHCNAGALATAGYGTALGVIYAAKENGKTNSVYTDETRPVLQGARLSAWELTQNQIQTTVICDNMAGYLMQQGKIDKIFVGADRIAKNGDVANKIGTYSLAVNAHFHKVPFYVVAPLSTIDLECPTGKQIPIEERHHNEIYFFNEKQMAPKSAQIYNPAFDVTPSHLVSGIITQKGIVESDFSNQIPKLFDC